MNRGHSAFSACRQRRHAEKAKCPHWSDANGGKPGKQNVPNRQRGFILLTVVVAITLLAAVAFVLGNQGATEAGMTSGELERDRLRYAAEAGIGHARLQLAQKSSCSGYTDIPQTDFGTDSYSATISPSNGSPVTLTATGLSDGGIKHTVVATSVRAYEPPNTVVMQLSKDPGKDAMIDGFYANANWGSIDDLIVRSDPSWIQRPLLEFDLSSMPGGVKIISATLELQLRIVSTPGDVGVHRITRSWLEGTGKGTGNADGATWNEYDGNNAWSQPGGDFDSTLYGTAMVSSAKNGQRVSWEIGDLVQGWVSGQFPNYGLALVGDGTVNNAEFESREEPDPAAAPRLTIVYACECGKTCAAVGGGGKKVLLVVGDTANLTTEQADKKALMEGWGHTVSLIATDDTQAGFDTAAALVDVVYVPELGAGPMGELGAKADNLAQAVITEEARKPLMLGSFSFSPFVDADTINITDNTQYITETLPTGNVLLSTAVQSMWVLKGTLAVDLHVLGQLGGTQPGLAYLEKGELRNDSSPAPARRVKLPWGSYNFDVNLLTDDGLEIMKRAIEWGAAEPAGGGVKSVLFVVGNVGGPSMTAEEIAHQTLIESWGHTVETIDDGASQADFDAAVASNDVVFMTNDITASTLGTKLVNATIGVVTSEDNLSDEFGMSSAIGWDSGTLVEINDNTHYITSPFPTGLLTILSTSESLAYVTGTLSTDLGQLASSTSGYGIVTLETGASMYGGGSAAGRRAQLPWGGNGFDPNNLTADGLTILQRAIEWGAGAGDAPAQVLLLVVPDEFSLGPQDVVRKTLIESWGYAVTLISAAATQSAFDIAVADSDVAYVSEEITSSEIGTKLRDATIGVVIEEQAITDEFGISSGNTVFTESSIDITDNLHYITSPLSLGEVAFAVSTQQVGAATGTLAGGLVILATRPSTSTGMLDVIDTGGALYDSGAAAGRRVKLPWGGNDFDINSLTADGQTIMRRAIEWGAGTEAGGGGGGGGGSCDGTYLDQFEIYQFDNSDGTLDWSTSPWQEIGESDGPTAGDIRIWSDLDSVRLRTRDNDNGGEGVEREADLSGAASATLSYDYRRDKLDNSNDYTTVEISANGASGPWTELARYAGPNNDSNYVSANHDISSYISSNTRIRFVTSPDMGNLDNVWLDNIQITCTP